MANVQIVRQCNVQRNPITTTKVDQVQSLQLVQTMLHGALSILTYSRGLFPLKVFEERFYDSPISYENFANGQMPTNKAEANSLSTKVPVLMRQRSKRADMLLDWLEKSVFPELESGELRAIQILIHPDHDLRDQVLETYTFTVHYTTDGIGERVPSGVSTGASSEETTITTETSSVALQQLLRRLAYLCDDLPNLPPKRMLSMGLVYDGRPSRDRLVEGFGPNKGSDLVFPATDGWSISTETYKFASGYHNSHLKITGMQPDQELLGGNLIHQLPNDLKFALRISRHDDILRTSAPIRQKPQHWQSRTTNPSKAPMSKIVSQQSDHAQDRPIGGAEINTARSYGFVNNDGRTQSNFTNRMNSDLGRMMQPEEITQGDTQPQGIFPASTSTIGGDDTVTATPTTRHASPGRAAEPHLQDDQFSFSLRASKKQDIMRQKAHLANTTREIAQDIGGMTQSGQFILCQCGFAGEEGDMVQCSICDTWQHLHCCGYVGENDPRIPVEHFCYACLVDEGDVATFKAVQELALQRRALFSICQYGMRTKADLSKTLGVSKQKGSDLHVMIIDGKYVEQAVNSHKSGYRLTGKALYVPVQDHAKLQELLKIYFDPRTAVRQHYVQRPDEIQNAQRVAEINLKSLQTMRADLPESAKRIRSGDRTPTPTPSPYVSQPYVPAGRSALVKLQIAQGIKRKAATDNVRDTRASARKKTTTPSARNQSLQSLMLIDACGDSSPLSWQGSAHKPRR